MKRTILAVGLLALAGCATGPRTEPKLGAREAEQLEKALAGKVPGKPVSCITSYDPSKLEVVGDHTLLYRVNKDLIYRNNLEGGCSGLSMGSALVMNRVLATQYCRGDIARAVDLQTRATTGSCALGDFIPYTPAGQ
ncbi:MAG: hypothetical protein J0G94_05520 [Sphingomonadales bacterium]|nr:hypothetical protein [Sphingomonadales bacterium]